MASTVALGIWKEDYKTPLKQIIDRLCPDISKEVNTPDESYKVFLWDWIDWDNKDTVSLSDHIKKIRHSYYELTDYGRIIEDIVPFDARGEDEEFNELITWTPQFFVFDQPVEIKNQCCCENNQENPKEILKSVVEQLGDSLGDCISEILGMDVSDAIDEAIHYFDKNETHWDDDWKISLGELESILDCIDMQITFVDNKFHITDNNGCCTFEDCDTPQEVLEKVMVFLDCYFLDGTFTDEVDFNADSYEEAENICINKNFFIEAQLIHAIRKAMDDLDGNSSKLNPYYIRFDVNESDYDEKNGFYKKGKLLIKGKNVLEGEQTPYKNKFLQTDEYTYIGIHSCNPGCYPFLDYLVIVRNYDLSYKKVKLWPVIGKNPLKGIFQGADGNVFVHSDKAKARVHTDFIFDNGDIRSSKIPYNPELQNKSLADCFEYDILDDYGVIMTFKEDVRELLKYPGFNLKWDTFKFWNLTGGTSYLLFIDSKTYNTWEITWGNSTSMVSSSVWDRRNQLIKCMKKKIPSHPAWKEEMFFEICQ